jgi:hypothetical protein
MEAPHGPDAVAAKARLHGMARWIQQNPSEAWRGRSFFAVCDEFCKSVTRDENIAFSYRASNFPIFSTCGKFVFTNAHASLGQARAAGWILHARAISI